uniref:C1q domain-containing protein n=2 Tax=Magallana gigas TaxID=29159 RepID=A0A8W8JG26_MAGGI|nr:complement C1q-like protein 4 [Crassostrea gigas]
MVNIKCMVLLCCVSLVTLGISANEEKNEAFAEDILTLRQELKTLKQKFLLQEQEIKLLKQEVAKPLNPNRKQGILYGKDQALMDLNNPQREKSRQERLLVHPTMNTSSPGNLAKIAFYANKITDYTNLGIHQILNFGNTITNKGNCYHHTTGNFIPNVSGVYVFYVHMLSSPGHILYTELMVEGAVMGTHYMAQSTYYSNGGGMAVVHVNAGDSVWVRVRTAESGTLIGWESSFSGFLLYPE